jgi:multidrug resistance efflux pump
MLKLGAWSLVLRAVAARCRSLTHRIIGHAADAASRPICYDRPRAVAPAMPPVSTPLHASSPLLGHAIVNASPGGAAVDFPPRRDRERAAPATLPPPPSLSSRPEKRLAVTDRTRRRATWIGLGLLVLFWLWIGWPYFSSIVVRDAAVTTWINTAIAPIDGELDGSALRPADVVGPDGRLAEITNPRADRAPLERALGDLAAAEARLAQIRRAQASRITLGASYAAAFTQQLDIRLAHEIAAIDFIGERLAAARADASRLATLLAAGSVSPAAAEESAARVAALEGERVVAQGALDRTRVRRASADRGLFLLEDGGPSSWDAQLDLLRAEQDTVAAAAELATAQAVAEATRSVFERQRTAILTAPPGARLWNRFVAPGVAVSAGTPVGAWIDPAILLVDVPLSDVEAALLQPGARADVVFEGERYSRPGVVVFTRGSAATVGARELAAVAKGRHAGVAQAIVRLKPRAEDSVRSPVGRAAYVDFPDVSIFSILRARVRL